MHASLISEILLGCKIYIMRLRLRKVNQAVITTGTKAKQN